MTAIDKSICHHLRSFRGIAVPLKTPAKSRKGGINFLKKNLSLRLDQEDYNLLDTQAKLYGVTKNEFVRVLIRKNMLGDIQELNENLKDIFRLKVSIGNNLNQIAKKCNSKTISDFREIQKELDDLWQSLKR